MGSTLAMRCCESLVWVARWPSVNRWHVGHTGSILVGTLAYSLLNRVGESFISPPTEIASNGLDLTVV